MLLFPKIVFSALEMRFSWQTKQKTLKVGRSRNCDEGKVFFFEQETFSVSKNASLPNWEGAKLASGSRPSCYSSF